MNGITRNGRRWLVTLGMACGVLSGCGDDRAIDDDDGGTTRSAGSGAASGSGSPSSAGSGASGQCGFQGDPEPANVAGITAAHNAVRCGVETDPAIPALSWSATVASVAQAYADQLASAGCDLVHSDGPYGENLMAGSGQYPPEEVVAAWVSEVSCFQYGPFDSCSCTCGHYTQVVWRESTELGCGVGSCSGGGQVWVCNYDPPGNYLGEVPY
jgi:uncharacterized protein YkwD